MAASRPTQGLPATVPATAAENAPNKSWASIAMLTTPERSHSRPPREPNTSGVASATDPASSAVMEMLGVWAVPTIHTRNPVTKKKPATITAQRGSLRARIAAYTARAASTIVTTQP